MTQRLLNMKISNFDQVEWRCEAMQMRMWLLFADELCKLGGATSQDPVLGARG